MITLYTVGQRVDTEWGVGTVIGFESFNAAGFSQQHSLKDNGHSRIVVKLDNPTAFALGEYGNPFFYRNDKITILEG